MTNKRLLADLDRVGRILNEAKKAGRKLSSVQRKEIANVISVAKSSIGELTNANNAASRQAVQKRVALYRSVKEGLMTKEASVQDFADIRRAMARLYAQAMRLKAAAEGIKNLEATTNRLSAAPELEKLDKGHATSEQIKAPAKSGSAKLERIARIRQRIAERRKTQKLANIPVSDDAQSGNVISGDDRLDNPKNGERPSMKTDTSAQSGETVPADTSLVDQGNIPVLEEGKPEAAQGVGSNPAVSMTATKKKATNLYIRAAEFAKQADLEKDVAKKKKLSARVTVLERAADKMVQSMAMVKGNKTLEKKVRFATLTDEQRKNIRARIAAKKKANTAATEKEAEKVIFAANDKVLLADGSIGSVKACVEDKVTVTIGGVDKEVLANTIRKLTSKSPEKKAEKTANTVENKETSAPKKGSVVDRVKEAIKAVRSGKKHATQKTAQDIPPAVAPDTPEEVKEEVKEVNTAPEGDTVGKSETKTVGINPDTGKWTANITDTAVVEFEDEADARSFITSANKVKEGQYTMDSADPSKPEGSEDGQKKMKGLDQKGKDYGTTSKDEKVDPQTGSVSKTKQSTAMNPGAPTDSSNAKSRPEGEAVGQNIMKGLDQKGKDYGNTKPDEKVNPQLSMLAGKLATSEKKVQVLAETNKKQGDRLKELEAERLVDRAVKVSAITEEQRVEQKAILAELYANARAEFRAYARLIDNMEAIASKSPVEKISDRKVRRIEASMMRKQGELVEAADSPSEGSLDRGNFFDE
jgi:hypothetical protein